MLLAFDNTYVFTTLFSYVLFWMGIETGTFVLFTFTTYLLYYVWVIGCMTGIGWYWTGGVLTICWITLCYYGGLTNTGDWIFICWGLTVLTSLTRLPLYKLGLTNWAVLFTKTGVLFTATGGVLIKTCGLFTMTGVWFKFLLTVTTFEVLTVLTFDALKGTFDCWLIKVLVGLWKFTKLVWVCWKVGTTTLEFTWLFNCVWLLTNWWPVLLNWGLKFVWP